MDKKSIPQFMVYAKRKTSKDTMANLYLKVTFNGEQQDKSLAIKCPFDKWRSEELLIEGHSLETHQLNQIFEEYKQKLMGAYYLLSQENHDFAIQDIFEVASGRRKPGALSFLQCFRDMIFRMEKLKGLDGNSDTNVQKHKRCLVHFLSFARKIYNTGDLNFQKITRFVVDDFVDYLKTEGNCSHNTSMKYLQIFKKVYRVGIDNGWVKMNAFANFKFRMKTVDREFLTEKELKILQKKKFSNKRLNFVRDLFVFSCLTGLAYVDLKALKRGNIVDNGDGYWIKIRRTKTGVESSIPLFPPAR